MQTLMGGGSYRFMFCFCKSRRRADFFRRRSRSISFRTPPSGVRFFFSWSNFYDERTRTNQLRTPFASPRTPSSVSPTMQNKEQRYHFMIAFFVSVQKDFRSLHLDREALAQAAPQVEEDTDIIQLHEVILRTVSTVSRSLRPDLIPLIRITPSRGYRRMLPMLSSASRSKRFTILVINHVRKKGKSS